MRHPVRSKIEFAELYNFQVTIIIFNLCLGNYRTTLNISGHSTPLLRWLYCREHLKYVWNVYCVVTNHMRDLHTTATTGHERFPSGHGTNYFRFVLTFSFFNKQLLFPPICFTVCAIIAKNIGLSDFEINYRADVLGETHATVVWDCWNSKQKSKQYKQKTALQCYKAPIFNNYSPEWRWIVLG